MDEQDNISTSEDSSSSSEEEDFDDIWESRIGIKEPEEASETESETESEADLQGSPFDTEVYSEKQESEVETTFPQTDFRSFEIFFCQNIQCFQCRIEMDGLPQVSGSSKVSIGTKITNLGEITNLKTNSSYRVQCNLCENKQRLSLISLAVSIIIILCVVLTKVLNK